MKPIYEYGIMAVVLILVSSIVIAVLALPTQPAKSHRLKDQARHHEFNPSSTGLDGLGIDGRFVGDQPAWQYDTTTNQFSPR